MTTFLTLFFWLLIGFSTAYFAQQRGRNPVIWFAIGIFFGLLGLAFVFLLPAIKEDGTEVDETDSGIIQGGAQQSLISPQEQEFLLKDWYYLDAQHKQQGPISFEILKKMFDQEEIRPTTFVWSETMPEWKKIEDLEVLEDILDKSRAEPWR